MECTHGEHKSTPGRGQGEAGKVLFFSENPMEWVYIAQEP
jgi:hypothetical protein